MEEAVAYLERIREVIRTKKVLAPKYAREVVSAGSNPQWEPNTGGYGEILTVLHGRFKNGDVKKWRIHMKTLTRSRYGNRYKIEAILSSMEKA